MNDRRRFVPHVAFRHAAAIVLFVAAMTVPTMVSAANAVDDWSAIAKTVIVDPAPMAARGGAASAIDFAYVHAAIYDAVNAIDGRYSVFAVRPTTSPVGASPEAATAAAASTVLKALFTTAAQQAYVDGQYALYLLGIPDGPAKTKGIAVGTEVAQAFLSLRAGDGRNAVVSYVFGTGPGVYQLTPGAPPPPATPATPWVAKMRPFMIKSPSQFRADGPPNLTSAQWAEDYNEVKTWGAKTGSPRTQAQTDIGWFYTDNPGAYGNRSIRGVALEQQLTLADSARFLAQTYLTLADTFISCWDSKFYYNFWRPVTAIRAGDTDDNDETEGDLLWEPLATTPNHPEYPSAHGCFTGAVTYSIENFFNTKKITTHFTAFSVPGAPGGVTHTFTRTQDILREVLDGRIFGGMHYRTSVVHGIVVSHKVAHWVAKHYFLPAD
jgi:hypothetical protein